ncbi:MAG: putative Ig domain-containing protein, partial [Planctomycetota bacterium]
MRPVIALALLLTLPAASALATDYHVGPGQTYANINDVPIESFAAGDTMFIHYRATPYAEKFVLCVQGTPGNPVTISGVADGDGNLPVLTGDGAVTRTQTNYWREDRGVIKIGGANTPGDTQPQYIIIENLDIRSARPGFTFTDDGGNSGTPYASNAAAVDVEKGDHLTIRNCIIHDCGNGIFAAGSTSDLTIERCYIHSNGIEGQFLEHNTYTESDGILYQYNHFGPLRASCDGNNLKDRSAGCVIRYNWIEGGNRQMDLVDSQDKHDNGATDYANTFVYGNVLLEGTNDGNRQIVHYGGDSGNIGVYRSHLYFHHNTIVSRRTDKTVMVRLSDTGTQLDAYNNIVYVTHAANQLAVLEETGVAHVENCWMRPGFINSHSGGGFTGSITYTGTVTGSDPGFEDFSADDFRLLATSTAHDAGAALLPATSGHDVTKHYLPHRAFETRTFEGTRDIGAYELGASAGSGEPTPGGGGGGGGGVGGGSGGCAAGASGSSLMLLPFLALLALLGVVRRRSEPRPSGSGTSEFPMNTAGAADVVSFPVPLPHGRGSDSLRGLAILLTTLLLVGCTTSGGGSLGGPSPVSITTASLPNGLRNNAYSQTLATSGGVAPLTFSISVGSLPAGLSLNASTGAITGTPTTAETQNFTITATDSATPATTDDAALSITINAPPALTITTTS